MQPPILSFRTGADADVAVDLDKLLAHKLAIQGNSGSGKSWLLRTLLEGTHGQVQHLVIDPEGEYRTLREVYDDYLILGREGDLSVTPESVGAAVRSLVPAGANLILDLSDYGESERDAICAAAVASLMALKRQAGRHLLVVCDEVQTLAPQSASSGASLSALTDLALRGRKRGFGLVISTQRLAMVNKNLLAMCSNRLFGLTTLGNDLRRAAEELGFNARERSRLKTLSPGEFFAFGPAVSQEVVKVRSAPVRSTHPTPGSVIPPTPPAGEALSKLLGKLRVEPEGGEQEPSTAPPLREAEIKVRVDAAVAARLSAHVDAAVAEVRGELSAEIESLRARVATLSEKLREIHTLSVDAAALERDVAPGEKVTAPLPVETSTPSAVAPALSSEAPVALATARPAVAALEVETPESAGLDQQGSPAHAPPAEADLETISAKEQRFIDTLASLHDLGLREVAREVAAPLSRQSHRSSAYTALVTDLHKRGLLNYPVPGGLALTEAGRAVATSTPKPLSDEELQRAWLGQLETYEERLARELLNAHPRALSRDELSVLTGYSALSSRFAAALTKLRKFGLADYPATGMVVAGTNFFLRPRELS